MAFDTKTQEIVKSEALKQKHIDDYKKFRVALQAMAQDPNGVIVLRHLAKICGFFKSSVVIKGSAGTMGGVDIEGTLVNEGRRGVYLDLRRPMSNEARRQIESMEGEENV
jgi:hypothetical protein